MSRPSPTPRVLWRLGLAGLAILPLARRTLRQVEDPRGSEQRCAPASTVS